MVSNPFLLENVHSTEYVFGNVSLAAKTLHDREGAIMKQQKGYLLRLN